MFRGKLCDRVGFLRGLFRGHCDSGKVGQQRVRGWSLYIVEKERILPCKGKNSSRSGELKQKVTHTRNVASEIGTIISACVKYKIMLLTILHN